MTSSTDASGREPETAPPAGVSLARQTPPLARRGRPTRLIAFIAVALLVCGAFWVVRSLRPHSGDARLAADAAAPTGAEMQQALGALNAHAAALLARDGSSWAAGLDADSRAADFYSRQRAVFANLAQVPVKTWRYSLTAPITSAEILDAAAERLGARVVVLHVQLSYALDRVDLLPTSKDEWLTLVKRANGWRIAGDTDAEPAGDHSWMGPWDFGPLSVRTGTHTLVLSHPAQRADLQSYGQLVEDSIAAVTEIWGPAWNSHVAVLIPSTEAEFIALTGDSGDVSNIAALSVADRVQADGTVLGARIVLNPITLARMDASGRRLVIRHELTHIAARASTSNQMPSWVVEGFADYVGNLDSGIATAQSASELAAEIRQGRIPGALPSNAEFDGSNSRLPQVYEESWLACTLVAQRVGQKGLVRFYKAVSLAARSDPANASEAALRSVLGISLTEFTRAWQAELRGELK
ncbi:hypothetical protein ACSMXN_16345 [Jatrophihabitans sp. DSM 45814]